MENSKKLVVYYSYIGHTKMIEDYHENQLVTSPDEVDNWIKKL